MKLVRYSHPLANSFGDFDRLFRSQSGGFGRLLELADRLSSPSFTSAVAGFAVDLYEDDDNYYARTELPGVKKKDLKVELHDRQLSISYEREKNGENEAGQPGSLKRVVSVPDGIDADKVGARLEDGILTITLPKSEARKPREIKVA